MMSVLPAFELEEKILSHQSKEILASYQYDHFHCKVKLFFDLDLHMFTFGAI